MEAKSDRTYKALILTFTRKINSQQYIVLQFLNWLREAPFEQSQTQKRKLQVLLLATLTAQPQRMINRRFMYLNRRVIDFYIGN